MNFHVTSGLVTTPRESVSLVLGSSSTDTGIFLEVSIPTSSSNCSPLPFHSKVNAFTVDLFVKVQTRHG